MEAVTERYIRCNLTKFTSTNLKNQPDEFKESFPNLSFKFKEVAFMQRSVFLLILINM